MHCIHESPDSKVILVVVVVVVIVLHCYLLSVPDSGQPSIVNPFKELRVPRPSGNSLTLEQLNINNFERLIIIE